MGVAIQSLNSRHFKIISLCLRGWTNKQIAEHLAMSTGQVSIIVNSPSFQHELSLRRSKMNDLSDSAEVKAEDEVTAAIRKGSLEAVQRLLAGLKSPDESVAIRSSTEILDRAGYPKTSRIESKNLTVILSAEDAKVISETFELDKD